MKTYRMRVPATLCFDVEAENDEEAKAKAAALCDRIWEEGADVPNADLDDELENATVYPQPNQEPVEIVEGIEKE